MDYKNGKSPVKVEDNLQLLTYSVLIAETHFIKPKKVINIIYQKNVKKRVVCEEYVIEDTRERLADIIKRVLAAEKEPLKHLNKGSCDFFCPAKRYHE